MSKFGRTRIPLRDMFEMRWPGRVAEQRGEFESDVVLVVGDGESPGGGAPADRLVDQRRAGSGAEPPLFTKS